MFRHFQLETACHEETWDKLADEDDQLSTIYCLKNAQ